MALLPAIQMMKDNQGLIMAHPLSLYSVSCWYEQFRNQLPYFSLSSQRLGSYWTGEGISLILTLPATHPMHSTHLQGFPSELSSIFVLHRTSSTNEMLVIIFIFWDVKKHTPTYNISVVPGFEEFRVMYIKKVLLTGIICAIFLHSSHGAIYAGRKNRADVNNIERM